MTRVEHSVVIQAPLDRVHAFASDWRNFARYFTYVRDVKPLTEHTLGEGARLELKVKFRGMPLTSQWVGVEDSEDAGWTFNAKLMGRWATKRWRLTPVDGSTRVTFTLEYDPPPLPLLDRLLIRPEWERVYKRSFEALKQLMESESTSAASTIREEV